MVGLLGSALAVLPLHSAGAQTGQEIYEEIRRKTIRAALSANLDPYEGWVREGDSVTLKISLDKANNRGHELVFQVGLKAASSSASNDDFTVASPIRIADGQQVGSTTLSIDTDEAKEGVEVAYFVIRSDNSPYVLSRPGHSVRFYIHPSNGADRGHIEFRVCQAANNACPVDGDVGWVKTATPTLNLAEGGHPVSYQYKLSGDVLDHLREVSVAPVVTGRAHQHTPADGDRLTCVASRDHQVTSSPGPHIFPPDWNGCGHKRKFIGSNERNRWHTVTFSAGEDPDPYDFSTTIAHHKMTRLPYARSDAGSYYSDPTGHRWPVKINVTDNDEWDQDFEFSTDGSTWTALFDGGLRSVLPPSYVPRQTYSFQVRLKDRNRVTRSTLDRYSLSLQSHWRTARLSATWNNGGLDESPFLWLDFGGNPTRVATVYLRVLHNAAPGGIVLRDYTHPGFWTRTDTTDGASRTVSARRISTVTVPDSRRTTLTTGQLDDTVVDEDTLPEVNVVGAGGVTEGDPVTFTVSASPPPAQDLPVSVTIAASGDFGYGTLPISVTIPTSGSATVTVTTADDDDEADGSVTLTLNDGDGYTLGALSSETAGVADDDELPQKLQQGPDWADYQTVVDYLIGIRDNPPNTAVKGHPVHIRKWNKVLATIGHPSTQDPMDASVIHANAARWPHSPFTAASYYLNSQQDPPPTPVVSIAAVGDVTEGAAAEFTVTANPVPTADLDVTVTITASGDYGATTGRRTVTVPTTGSVTLSVGTSGDDADEADGSVTAALVDSSAYDLGTTSTATVTVSDDDNPPPTPVVTISGGSGITEGGDASFALTATPAPASGLVVSFSVSTAGDYGASTGSRTVTVPTTGSVTFSVATTGDSTDEPDGSVTVTLVDGTDYDLGTSKTATVAVADDDDPPPPPLAPLLIDSVEAVPADCGDTAPTLSISSPTASRSDATADFEVSLDCEPARSVVILLAPVRDGVQGSYIFVSLSAEEPSAMISVSVRGARELSLVIGWSSGFANSEAQGDVAFTD